MDRTVAKIKADLDSYLNKTGEDSPSYYVREIVGLCCELMEKSGAEIKLYLAHNIVKLNEVRALKGEGFLATVVMCNKKELCGIFVKSILEHADVYKEVSGLDDKQDWFKALFGDPLTSAVKAYFLGYGLDYVKYMLAHNDKVVISRDCKDYLRSQKGKREKYTKLKKLLDALRGEDALNRLKFFILKLNVFRELYAADILSMVEALKRDSSLEGEQVSVGVVEVRHLISSFIALISELETAVTGSKLAKVVSDLKKAWYTELVAYALGESQVKILTGLYPDLPKLREEILALEEKAAKYSMGTISEEPVEEIASAAPAMAGAGSGD